MTHYSRLSKVVIDVPPADHDRELAFWSAAVGQPLTRFDRHPEYHGAVIHGQDFSLLIQRLGQDRARVHIDIHTDDLPAEIARLEKLGAERVQQAHSWQVMRDPAGLLFCVIRHRPERSTTATPSAGIDPNRLSLLPRGVRAAQSVKTSGNVPAAGQGTDAGKKIRAASAA